MTIQYKIPEVEWDAYVREIKRRETLHISHIPHFKIKENTFSYSAPQDNRGY